SPTVRHVTATCSGATTTVNFSPSLVSLNDAFVLFSSTRASAANQNVPSTRTVRLSGLNQATVEHNVATACSGDAFPLQVVEYPGGSVATGSGAIAAGALATTLSVTPNIDLTRALLLHTWRSGAAATGCARPVRGAITTPNTLTFARGAGNAMC